jgi:hypothetical protein
MTIDEVLADYEDLERDDILAVIVYDWWRMNSRPSATMLASEAVLARDWLTPEEDAAWAHL